MHTAMFNMDRQPGPTVQHGELAHCRVAAWMGGVWGITDASVGVSECLCCPPETITALLISDVAIQSLSYG